MENIVIGTALLIFVIMAVKFVIAFFGWWFKRQERADRQAFRRMQIEADAQAIAHIARTQRNHRQFDRQLWDRR